MTVCTRWGIGLSLIHELRPQTRRFGARFLSLAGLSLGLGVALLSQGAPASPAVDLQCLLDAALASRAKEVTIPPGIHRVKLATAKSAYHLTLAGAKDLVIRGAGATLVFENPQAGGILFERCSRVTVSGLTLDWDPLPFTQGRITAIHLAEASYDVQVDTGYSDDPDPFAKGVQVFLYDPQTWRLKRGGYEMFDVGATRVSQGLLRLRFKSAQPIRASTATVGDWVVAGLRKKIGMRMLECAGMVVEGVTIWAAPGIALQEAGGAGGSRYTYTVTPGPAPAGGPARLMSTDADAFNSTSVHQGPVVENCLFEAQGDDGIAIKGTYVLVSEETTSGTLRISPKHEMVYRAGDRLRVYSGRGYQLKGEATITAVQKAEAPAGAGLEALRACWQRYREDLPGKRYYTLTLDQPIQAEIGDLASSPDWDGSGFIIRNNVIRYCRGRGMIVKASDGLIESNRVENITGAGICLGPEFAYWMESDYVQKVSVRGNRLHAVGIGADSAKNERSIYVGAITVCAATPDKQVPGGTGNRNLVIEGNDMEASGGIGMMIACASDVVVRSNRVGTTRALGTMVGGAKYGVDPDAAIFVTESARVRLEGNQVGGKGIVLGTNVVEIVR